MPEIDSSYSPSLWFHAGYLYSNYRQIRRALMCLRLPYFGLVMMYSLILS